MFFDDDEATNAAVHTKQMLLDTQQRMGIMLDSMPMGLIIHTQQGIIFANREAANLLQVGQDELVGMHFLDFLGEDFTEASRQMDAAFHADIMAHAAELTLRNPVRPRTINLIAGPLPWQGNSVIQLLLQDITDLKEKEDALRRLTITDELTGAYNRRYAFEIGRAASASSSSDGSVCVIAMDIDHFKKINDVYGHAAGDRALKLFSSLVSDFSSSENLDCTFARIGGEEFVAILPSSNIRAAASFAERLRLRIAALIVDTPDATFQFTVSFGVAASRGAKDSFESLLGRADAALYAAKHGGRNRVVVESDVRSTQETATAA